MGNPYRAAIAHFENLIHESREHAHTSPARLVRAAGLPKTSGYRHIAAMEAAGFVSRDDSGTYQLGPIAQRVGLAAWKIGNLSPIILPVLRQLKQWHQCTSFLGVAENHILHIGPYSVGQSSLEPCVEAKYLLGQSLPIVTESAEISLTRSSDDFSKKLNAIIVPIMVFDNMTVLIGMFMPGSDCPSNQLGSQLELLAEKIQNSLETES